MIRYRYLVCGEIVGASEEPNPDMYRRLVRKHGRENVEMSSIIYL